MKWHVYASDTGASYQAAFDAETHLVEYPARRLSPHIFGSFWRPHLLFRVQRRRGRLMVGTARDDISGFRTELDNQKAAGFNPSETEHKSLSTSVALQIGPNHAATRSRSSNFRITREAIQ